MRYFYLPFLKNYIILILLQGIGLGIKVMVMTDYLTLSKNTIGCHLYWAKAHLDYDYVFAWTFIIVVLSLLLDGILRRIIVYYRKVK